MSAKAPPKSKPGKWDKPELQVTHTKKGPGRKAGASADRKASRVTVAPEPAKKLIANVGREPRRVWRDGEPLHIVKPVRFAHRKSARDKAEAERHETASRA